MSRSSSLGDFDVVTGPAAPLRPIPFPAVQPAPPPPSDPKAPAPAPDAARNRTAA
jgi:hypothetical protein